MSSTAASATTVLERQGPLATTAGPLGVIQRFPVAALVILTFALTWLFEIPRVLDARGELPFAFPFWAVILMGWMPGVAAIIVAASTGGRAAVRTLFGRFFIWRVGWPWYLPVVGGTAGIWLTAVELNRLFGGSGVTLPDFSTDVLVGLLIEFVLLFLVNSEELVWRGSMLPMLQARCSALTASIILGVFETLFHLPLFFQPDTDQAATGLPVFFIGSVAGAIIFTWLFNNTMGSLLLVQLFHIWQNTWISLFVPTAGDNVTTQWLFNAVFVVIATIVLLACGPRRLSRKPEAELPVVRR